MALGRTANAMDDRLHVAQAARRSLRKVFPDHWSFLLGEVALYSFIILILTGIFLTFFFSTSMTKVVYHGGYIPLRGVKMSEAYSSTLYISFDVRGGLLIRQIHHWAALLFVAAIGLHLLRIFFTGAFRKPREINWVIGLTMFALAAGEGFMGYSMPDDLLSGTGLRIADGVILSIPIVGTYLSFFLFGGEFPGHLIVARMYILHVLILPGLILALVTVHLFLIWYQGHTQWPGRRERDHVEVGNPMYPVFMAKTGALFFFTFAAVTLAGAFVQINPIWLWGPYNPLAVSIFSQPDWYIGFLEGSLRLMPNWSTVGAGHTVAWNVFVPAILLPGLFFVLAGLYPSFEQHVTGDWREHRVLDRPRNAPTRAGIGAAVIAMAVVIQVAGGDDVIAGEMHMPLEYIVWTLRVGFFLFPVLAFVGTRYACLGLQNRDRRALSYGLPTGRVVDLPEGGYAGERRTLTEDESARLASRRPDEFVAAIPRPLIPLPTRRRIRAQVLSRLNRAYTRTRLEPWPMGDGQGADHAEDESHSDGARDGQRAGGSEDARPTGGDRGANGRQR